MLKFTVALVTAIFVIGVFIFVAPEPALTSQVESPVEKSSSLKQLEQSEAGRAEVFDPAPEMSPANGYLARIMMDSPEDLEKALKRAEELYERGIVSSEDNPLAFVIHGPEVRIFFKDNYQKYKSIVDLAAKLSAFNVVDVRVCETRMSTFGENPNVLPPFVDTVHFGPAEVERLVAEEGYLYF